MSHILWSPGVVFLIDMHRTSTSCYAPPLYLSTQLTLLTTLMAHPSYNNNDSLQRLPSYNNNSPFLQQQLTLPTTTTHPSYSDDSPFLQRRLTLLTTTTHPSYNNNDSNYTRSFITPQVPPTSCRMNMSTATRQPPESLSSPPTTIFLSHVPSDQLRHSTPSHTIP